MKVRAVFNVFRDAFLGWSERKAPLHAAALAYSTLFSLAPLLIISVTIASMTVPRAVVEARLVQTIESQVGQEVAELTREILGASYSLEPNGLVTLFSFLVLLYGASTVFVRLRGALDAMWGIDQRNHSVQQTILGSVKSYLVSAVIALGVGLVPIMLLFVSALAASVPSATILRFSGLSWLDLLIRIFSSPVVYFVLFALIFRFMPHGAVKWRAVWPGASLSAMLYWLGSAVLSWYVQNSALRSFYGAAGSAIALLIWTYYSAWILLYGAKFIQVYAERRGYPIVPDADAAFVEVVVK